MTSERAEPTRPDIRLVANRYLLQAHIGRGGMGVVWRGEDRVIGRPVAVKELRLPQGAGGPGSAQEAGMFQERVLREVRTGGRLNDPAVVTVFDVVTEQGEHGPTTFIVMELVEAPTLSALISERGALPPQQVAEIGLQVLSALNAAHAAGIVHRDVKPGNIMVAANGRVKLTDFGIAQAVDDPRLTTSGTLVGSPAFMAPERVAGAEAIPASDLWALGATLYAAVEGKGPFERGSTAATLHAIMNEVPYLTRVQGPLASAISGLLTAKPEGRLSAEQARGLLETARTGQSQTQALGQPAAYAGVALAPVTAAPATPASGTVAPQGKSRRGLWWTVGILAVVGALAGGLFLGRWWGSSGSPESEGQLDPALTYGPGGDIQLPGNFGSTGSERCVNGGKLDTGRNYGDSNDAVECTKAHDFEVFDAGSLYENTDSDGVEAQYPGVDRLAQVAEARCATTFHGNAIDERKRGGLSYRPLIPSQQAWQQKDDYQDHGERSYYCVLYAADGAQMSEQISRSLK